jgi:hypothetical protein
MRKVMSITFAVFLTTSCTSIRLVSSYDEVIDKGITEFAEQFNTFIKNMGDAAGREEGTYDASAKTYNTLSSKLDVLIARAASASDGKGCKVETKIYERIDKIMQDKMPPELKQAGQNPSGNEEGCNERLLVLVQSQLETVKKIHKTTDKCETSQGKQVSCLRPATVKSILEIANQSINAVSVVETAKKM